jgi:hypothetical protein
MAQLLRKCLKLPATGTVISELELALLAATSTCVHGYMADITRIEQPNHGQFQHCTRPQLSPRAPTKVLHKGTLISLAKKCLQTAVGQLLDSVL